MVDISKVKPVTPPVKTVEPLTREEKDKSDKFKEIYSEEKEEQQQQNEKDSHEEKSKDEDKPKSDKLDIYI